MIGPRVRQLRQSLDLTQAAMADDLGISTSYMNLIERNQRPMRAKVLLRLAVVIMSAHCQAHDYIDFFRASKQSISERCAELYRLGYLLREIAEETGIPKTTGIVQCKSEKRKSNLKIPARKSPKGVAPYGFAWLGNKLVVDPKEIISVHTILKFREQNKTLREIANHLNGLGIIYMLKN